MVVNSYSRPCVQSVARPGLNPEQIIEKSASEFVMKIET